MNYAIFGEWVRDRVEELVATMADRLLALDPGTTHTGWVWMDGGKVGDCGVMENKEVLDLIECH